MNSSFVFCPFLPGKIILFFFFYLLFYLLFCLSLLVCLAYKKSFENKVAVLFGCWQLFPSLFLPWYSYQILFIFYIIFLVFLMSYIPFWTIVFVFLERLIQLP